EDGNVLLCGSTFASRLEKVSSFRFIKDGPSEGGVNVGPNLFGTIKGTMRVFKDPFFAADKAILVHKSNNWMYQGFLHCVYVPIWISETIAQTTFTFAKGIMSRYVNVAKNGDFAATITVT
ncbi:MAG TPA: hypothetical protein VMW36_01205, partial [Patescibacteria group bacterium]|nr:hypothetical protein [Patescibacteria group bacterium]